MVIGICSNDMLFSGVRQTRTGCGCGMRRSHAGGFSCNMGIHEAVKGAVAANRRLLRHY